LEDFNYYLNKDICISFLGKKAQYEKKILILPIREKWAKDWKGISQQRTWKMAHKHLERCSFSLEIQKMQN